MLYIQRNHSAVCMTVSVNIRRVCNLIQLFYCGMFALSFICTAIYLFMWHKHFDVNFTMIFTLVPITCLGYFFSSLSRSLEEAVFSMKMIYIGGCFLQLFMILNIFNLCRINITKWGRIALFIICSVLYTPIVNLGYGNSFYGHL